MSTSSVSDVVAEWTERATDRSLLSLRGRQFLSLIGLVAIWWLFYQFGVLNFEYFVSPTTAFAELVDVLLGQPMTEGGSTIYLHAAYSTARVTVSVAIAAILAIPLGLLVGTSRQWGNALYPALEAFRPIPPIAWLPVAIILFPSLSLFLAGQSLAVPIPALFVVFIGAFFPIFINTIEGARNVEDEYARAAESLGASSIAVFRHVLLPAALPSIITGLSLGVGLGWLTVVAAELITGGPGLGYIIIQSFRLLNNEAVVIGMIAIGGLGYASSALVQFAGRRLTPWSDSTGET